MKKLNLKEIEKELKQLTSITDKLEFWNNIFIENIAKPLNEKINKSFQINMQNEKELLTQLFGNKYTLKTTICIPQKLYSVYFEPFKNKAEYSYWFLNRDADAYFKALIKGKNFEEKLISDIAKIHIEKELKQISEFESHAERLFNDNAFDIYKKYSYTQYEYNQYAKEIEYLRIKENYYQNHYLSDEQFTIVIELYAIHVLFKDYLLNKQYEVSTNFEPLRLLEKDIKHLISEQQKTRIVDELKINFQNDSKSVNTDNIDNQINTLNDLIEKTKRAYLTKTIVEAMQIAEKQYLHAIKLKFDNKCPLAIARFQYCEIIKNNLNEFSKTLKNTTDENINDKDKDAEIDLSDTKPNKKNIPKTEMLYLIKDAFKSITDFNYCIDILNTYFKGEPLQSVKKIEIKSRNVKRLAKELGILYRDKKDNTIEREYFELIIKLFDIFENMSLSNPLSKTTIYKYLHQNN